MDKHIGHTIIENTATDWLLTEYQKRQIQAEQYSRLKLIPWCWESYEGGNLLLFLRSLLPSAGGGGELMETENDTARTVFGDNLHFP